MTFNAASTASTSVSMASSFLCVSPELAGYGMDAAATGDLFGSTLVYASAGLVPNDSEQVKDAGLAFTYSDVPDRATPENAHLFPALLREIEHVEVEQNRARNPWARAFWSRELIAQSGSFADYVSPDGHLTEGGEEYLSTLKDREIDPDRIVAATPKEGSRAEEAEAAPTASSDLSAQIDSAELRWASTLFNAISYQTVSRSTLGNQPIDPGRIDIAAYFLRRDDPDLATGAAFYLAAAAQQGYDISKQLPALEWRMNAEPRLTAAAYALEAINCACGNSHTAREACRILVEALAHPSEQFALSAKIALREHVRSYSVTRADAVSALRAALDHKNPRIKAIAEGLLRDYEGIMASNLRGLLLRDAYWGGRVDMVEGPARLAEQIRRDPSLVRIAVRMMERDSHVFAQGIIAGLGLAAEDPNVDVTPALEGILSRLFPNGTSTSTSRANYIYTNAMRAAIGNPKSRGNALVLLARYLKSGSSEERQKAYWCLASSENPDVIRTLAQGLADSDSNVRNFVFRELFEAAASEAASEFAYAAVTDMLSHPWRRARETASGLLQQASRRRAPRTIDGLVNALADTRVSVPVARTLVNAAMHIDGRAAVYAGLIKGFTLESIQARSEAVSVALKLLMNEKTAANTLQWLLLSEGEGDPSVRSGIAQVLGRAVKEGRVLESNERDLLARLERDRDSGVRTQARWALEQNSQARGR